MNGAPSGAPILEALRVGGIIVRNLTPRLVSIPEQRNENTKYYYLFIFSVLRSGVEAKRGVEFHHSTRNSSRTRRKVENGMRRPTLLCAGYSVNSVLLL